MVTYGGKVILPYIINSNEINIILYNVALVKNTPINLVSTGQLNKGGMVVDGLSNNIVIKNTLTIIAKLS